MKAILDGIAETLILTTAWNANGRIYHNLKKRTKLMRKTKCQCNECIKLRNEKGASHDSDCAVHNMPEMANKKCNCTKKKELV